MLRGTRDGMSEPSRDSEGSQTERTASDERERDRTMSEDSITDSGDEQVICQALRLALVATQLRVAWHAGAISPDRAMEILDQQFFEIGRRARDRGVETPTTLSKSRSLRP